MALRGAERARRDPDAVHRVARSAGRAARVPYLLNALRFGVTDADSGHANAGRKDVPVVELPHGVPG
ncbi:hypothetical protein QJS66_11785 [Kocuria rhizophila]|nr:hypothetical protein QJS66_11785 [Kocuria rhizophila]